MLMDTSSDKIDKIFDEERFVLKLNVNIITWIYLFNEMLLCFIMNLYVSFGILFDHKRYYKDGDSEMMLRRPSILIPIRHMAPLPPHEQRHPILRFAAGRKSGAYISGGKFMGRLAQHFGLLTSKILQGLTVIAPELPIIDTAELDAPSVDEGGQADPAPTQAPPLLPADARTMPQRMARLEEDVYEIRGTACVTYVIYFETPREYTRHVRCMTDGASTSTAQQGPQQPDP
ncbi:hypothetical protein Tco_0814644 [Tanacetum coccineum]